ncbi:GNAT family N-acetyltransferase [Kibdelosporangium aridum]|uniref:Acetyltransferase (GNAT) family protein n=1 Tax=Kibdelosporangium aridum TaxID=2030 RepID=A0A1W2FTF8_KIBAR|nr:GNAT family N-acetyltransferase [Kibdelosporangium aridum]SMD25153.1 Acetyltransferase (GNAT) family protein [Kibdelosporangium aridum]
MPTIRAATVSDLPAVLGLYAELHPDDPVPSTESAQRAWRAIQAQPCRTILVAEADSGLLGTTDCAIQANLTRNTRSLMLIENFVVVAAAQRTGVGSALLREAVRLAREADCYKVQLLSRATRTDAHAFYESQGFQPLAQGYRRYL